MNFFNFSKKKNSYSCPLLNNHLHFTSRDTLEPCCSANIGPVLVNKLSTLSSIKDLVKQKQKYIKMLKDGHIPQSCQNCVHFTFYKKCENLKINKITLNHYTQCNCACIYCTQGNRTIEKIKEDENKPVLYDVLKFINELYDLDLIDKEKLYIDFQGGNISCLKNHQIIINTFLNRGVGTIYIPTNNIVYLPAIENILKLKKGAMCTALDSGSKETYLKIKQVDKFEKSVSNLKRYVENAGNESIIVKYIIINGINDNLDEFKQFIHLMKSLNIKFIVVDIDYRDIIDKTYIIPQHYYDIINYAKEYCTHNKMKFKLPPYTSNVLHVGHSN